MSVWITIVGMTLVTFATRALPLLRPLGLGHPLARRALHYAPPAILAALAASALLATDGGLEPGPRLWAGLLGVAVALRTASLPLTIATGLAAFVLFGG